MAREVRQYAELAGLYDLLYRWKDYGKEAEILAGLIRKYKRTSGNSLLDVGCGTGQHIKRLKGRFDCVGVDVNDRMLEQARKNVGGVEFVHGDMVDFDLGRKFDVVLCLFSSIGFLKTHARLEKAIRNFAGHLREGGVVIIEPWFTKDAVKSPHISVLTEGSDDLKVVRVDHSEVKGGLSIIDERIVVAEKGAGIRSYGDRMELALFEKDEFLRLMRKAGLRPRFLKRSLAPGRGLYVGVLEKA